MLGDPRFHCCTLSVSSPCEQGDPVSLCLHFSESRRHCTALQTCRSVWGFCFPGACHPRDRVHLQATLETCVGTVSGHLTACRMVQPQIIYFLRIPVVIVSRDGRASPFSLSFCEEIPLALLGPWPPRTSQNQDLTVAGRGPVRPEPI